jgi:hypothetical protein
MVLYEMRTYTLYAGKMAEAVKLIPKSATLRCSPAGRPRSFISGAMLAPSTHPHLEIRGRRRSPQALGRSVRQCRPHGLCRQIPTARHDAARQGYAARALGPPSLNG